MTIRAPIMAMMTAAMRRGPRASRRNRAPPRVIRIGFVAITAVASASSIRLSAWKKKNVAIISKIDRAI